MTRDVSDNFKLGSFAAQTELAYIILLTIEHDDLAEPIQVTPDPMSDLGDGIRGVISNGLEYVALPFEIVLPGEDEDGQPVSRIRMDNISREIALAVRSINSAPDVSIQIVLSSDPDVQEILIDGFQLGNIRLDALTVEGELNTERIDQRQFPPKRFTPSLYPALH